MSNLDPYDVLGLQHGCTWGEVKVAYKKMCVNTHPDRMNGDAKYFMMVHDAFNKLQERHNDAKKYKNLPKTKVSYDPEILNKSDSVTPQKLKNFTPERFNFHFNKNKISDCDPYASHGYGHMIAQSGGKNREDIDIAKKEKVHIPKQSLVVYKEPECLPSSSNIFGNCYEFGNTKVEDFSGGGGTDIMQAYCERPELVDTQVRYKSLDDINASRSGQNMAMTEEEKAYYTNREIQKQRLEQYRLNEVQNNNQNIANKYVQLHRRLM